MRGPRKIERTIAAFVLRRVLLRTCHQPRICPQQLEVEVDSVWGPCAAVGVCRRLAFGDGQEPFRTADDLARRGIFDDEDFGMEGGRRGNEALGVVAVDGHMICERNAAIGLCVARLREIGGVLDRGDRGRVFVAGFAEDECHVEGRVS